MKRTSAGQSFAAFCGAVLLLALSNLELFAQDEIAPPARRGRRGAAAPGDPNAKPYLEGRIVDDQGKPVTDARLTIRGTPTGVNRGLQSFSAATDENGRYSFRPAARALQAGEFRLQILSQDCIGITGFTTLPPLSLSPETTTTRDFTLKRAARIRVQVVNELLEPIPGVRMLMISMVDGTRRYSNAQITTDAAGTAILGGVAPSDADYLIAAWHDEYAYGKIITKLLDVDKVASGLIILTKGEEVNGTAICADGKPAAGWSIVAMPDWWRFPTSPSGSEIGQDGSFTLKHITADAYDVSISLPFGEGSTTREQLMDAVKLLPRDGPLSLKLKQVSPQSMGAIAGTVRLAGPAPATPIRISASPLDGQEVINGVATVRDGKFRITMLPPGRYSLRFLSSEIEEKTIPNVVSPIDNLEVDLVARGKLMFRGMAVRADTGEPLKQFRVQVAKLRELHQNYTRQDDRWHNIDSTTGEFEIELSGPGIYQAIVASDGLAWTRSEQLNTDENKGQPVRIAATTGATLVGSVVDERGQPVDGATVIPASRAAGARPREYSQFSYNEGSVKTVAGRFTFEHLEPGKERLKVSHPDYTFTITENINIPAAGATVPPITLRAGGTVRGRVNDAEGRPKRNVTLLFRSQSSSSYPGDTSGLLATATTNAQGDYEVRRLPEELCYVTRQQEIALNGQSQPSGTVALAIRPKNGEIQKLDFGGETPVAGKLVVNGQPLAKTRLQLGGPNPYSDYFVAYAQTDNAGNFIFWSPAPGKRTLYYTQGERRPDWMRVREIEVTGDPIDVGDIKFNTTKLLVRVSPLPEPAAGEFHLSLQRDDPISGGGSSVSPTKLSDDQGTRFEFAAVAPGTYELSAYLQSFAADGQMKNVTSVRQSFEITAAQEAKEFDIRWPQGTASVRGRYANRSQSDAQPPISILSKDRRIAGSILLRPDNSFEVSGLPAGDYFVALGDYLRAQPLLNFSLAEGATKSIEISSDDLNRAARDFAWLTVRPYSSAGLPLPGCEFSFRGAGDPPRLFRASEAYYVFMANPGEYEMTVAYPGFEPVRRKVTFALTSSKAPPETYDAEVILQPRNR